MSGVWSAARECLERCANGTGLSTGEIGDRIDFDKSEIGSVLRQMERRGLVARVPGSAPIRWALVASTSAARS